TLLNTRKPTTRAAFLPDLGVTFTDRPFRQLRRDVVVDAQFPPVLEVVGELPNLDFPTDSGHPVKGVNSPREVHRWPERDAPTPPSSRPKPFGSSPSGATPS